MKCISREMNRAMRPRNFKSPGKCVYSGSEFGTRNSYHCPEMRKSPPGDAGRPPRWPEMSIGHLPGPGPAGAGAQVRDARHIHGAEIPGPCDRKRAPDTRQAPGFRTAHISPGACQAPLSGHWAGRPDARTCPDTSGPSYRRFHTAARKRAPIIWGPRVRPRSSQFYVAIGVGSPIDRGWRISGEMPQISGRLPPTVVARPNQG